MVKKTRHGATRRHAKGVVFDRWLDRAVSVTVITALVVGLAAVIAHWWL